MSAILQQLGIDQTFFVQFGIFAVFFLVLSQFYFKPFLKLFEARHKKTVEDREAAERMMAEAETKMDEYKRQLAQERSALRKQLDEMITEARREENAIVSHAREEAKKITQEAADSVARQKDQLKHQLEIDVESLARSISERLVSRKI